MKKHNNDLFKPSFYYNDWEPKNIGITVAAFGPIFVGLIGVVVWAFIESLFVLWIALGASLLPVAAGMWIVAKATSHVLYGISDRRREIFEKYKSLSEDSRSMVYLTPEVLREFPEQRLDELRHAVESLHIQDEIRMAEEARLNPVAVDILSQIEEAEDFNRLYVKKIAKVMGDQDHPKELPPKEGRFQKIVGRLPGRYEN